MAAFSFQSTHYFPLDSIFMPKNTTTKMSNNLGDESNINNMNSTFSQVYCPQDCVESICLDHNYNSMATAVAACSNDNDLSVTKKQNTTESNSSVVDMLENGEQVTQRVTNMDKKRKNKSFSSLSSAQYSEGDEDMSKKQKKSKGSKKKEQEKKPKADKKVEAKAHVEPPTGYIHVRARRGQATDSHSLAERVRREKISERMKILQSLVPGCEKVTGKALVLDEIINYVQSLQNQVEFLSMKIASMNPLFLDSDMDLKAFTLDSERVNSTQFLPQFSPTQPIYSSTFNNAITTTTNTLNTTGSYPLPDTSPIVLRQGQRPHANSFPQDGGSPIWDVHDQRQKFLNPFGYANNNLCSFN